MGKVNKLPLDKLGYDWTNDEETRSYYHLASNRNKKNKKYRNLSNQEVSTLIQNQNYSPNWENVLVTDQFNPDLVNNSKFYGKVCIGNLSPFYLDYKDLKLPTGIYNSQIINCEIGDDNAIHHVRYMSNYITGNEVILLNINDMETSKNAKFGNGIIKEDESEEKRIWIELCNENGGRPILPFDGMQATDAYIWTRNRHDAALQDKLKEITEAAFSKKGGYYSEIGNQVVIKNSNMINDVIIGDHAYIKGVNKLKNVTIHSTETAITQIGEGCEIVNGIIGYGCRIFYGVKAVRFILSSFSQLKYGARLINSFLGDNSTISCCEVLNSLLFPAHEQHHNNSFLCAALIMGQSNMAAGATIGSNHNSRSADGEIIANRGFWPGLCVSLKHNSKFASYSLIVKGDFLHELNIKLPFSLISTDVQNDRLIILPGYWFLYNMYAVMRNSKKFVARDKRTMKNQHLEYDVLAPDTINEMFDSLDIIEEAVGKSIYPNWTNSKIEGKKVLLDNQIKISQDIYLENVECSKRKVVLLKPRESYNLFKKLIRHYAATQILDYLVDKNDGAIDILNKLQQYKDIERKQFENIGGQIVPKEDLKILLEDIKADKFKNWQEIHQQYHKWSANYNQEKLAHALASLAEITKTPIENWGIQFISNLIEESIATQQWIYTEIYNSRKKDYENPFRSMVYENEEEMNVVIGSLEDNAFIKSEKEELTKFVNKANSFLSVLSNSTVNI